MAIVPKQRCHRCTWEGWHHPRLDIFQEHRCRLEKQHLVSLLLLDRCQKVCVRHLHLRKNLKRLRIYSDLSQWRRTAWYNLHHSRLTFVDTLEGIFRQLSNTGLRPNNSMNLGWQSLSDLWDQYHRSLNFVNSTSYNFVIKQLLAQTGPSTLDLYSRAIDTTQIWMTHIGVTWNDISLHYLVIILDNAREASKSDAQSIRLQPPQLLRGLRWLAKTALMDSLAGILNNFLMASFLKGPGQPKDRKEAMPIPMLVLLRWEETVLNPSSPQWLTLLLGGFLLATWASLRYADLQRTDLSNLSLASSVLRGICRLTKTTRTGQPFGISLFGMTAISPQTCWVTFWLRVVQMALHRTKPFQPDFAIPVLTSYSAPAYIAPLSYASALKALRWAAQTPWMQRTLTPEMAQSLTLHSLKVTFLASAAQLRLPTRARQLQGHHTTGSMQLYSRDDTVDAIWLQEQISQQLRQGWRPSRPLQRGGQHPLPEPSFRLPFSTLPPSIDIPVEPGLSLFQLGLVSEENLETHLDPDDSSTSTSLSTCSSDSEESPEILPSENLPTIFIQNGPAGCCHAATVATVDLPTRRFLEHQDQSWSPRCGAALRPSAKVISLDQVQWPCNRASCRRVFDSQAPKDA